LPATRYFWPISPRGDDEDSTFLIVVSGMSDLPVYQFIGRGIRGTE
jgi:hypothetical protein